jgi:hypothetical protein
MDYDVFMSETTKPARERRAGHEAHVIVRAEEIQA